MLKKNTVKKVLKESVKDESWNTKKGSVKNRLWKFHAEKSDFTLWQLFQVESFGDINRRYWFMQNIPRWMTNSYGELKCSVLSDYYSKQFSEEMATSVAQSR